MKHIFRFFSEQKMKILKNRNFENFEISKFWKFWKISTFSKFRFFKIFIFWSEKIWKYFSIFRSRNFFGREKIFSKFFFLPISTQICSKIPKIVLRKPCDEPKHAKTSILVCLHIWNTWDNPPSNLLRTSSDLGSSSGIRSYGSLFFRKCPTKHELFS